MIIIPPNTAEVMEKPMKTPACWKFGNSNVKLDEGQTLPCVFDGRWVNLHIQKDQEGRWSTYAHRLRHLFLEATSFRYIWYGDSHNAGLATASYDKRKKKKTWN